MGIFAGIYSGVQAGIAEDFRGIRMRIIPGARIKRVECKSRQSGTNCRQQVGTIPRCGIWTSFLDTTGMLLVSRQM
jgi:hypothetical protein